MVKVSYRYSCGCGFSTDNEEEGKKHVKETKHKLDIKGMIVP